MAEVVVRVGKLLSGLVAHLIEARHANELLQSSDSG